MFKVSCLLQDASPPGMFSFACQKRTRKAPATFEAREARTRGCSPLVTPKLLGSIQKIQAAALEDFLCSADFEFLSASSIWCHPVIFSDIWFPLCKGKIHALTNNNLKYPRFFDAFSLYSVFSIWIAQMEIGGMFRRDAEPVIQDCAHRLFSFFGKYFKPVQFRGRLICIQNEATKPGAHPGSDTQ